MSNEEKILSMLTKMQSDIDRLSDEVETIKNNELLKIADKSQGRQRHSTYDALLAMSEMLTQEEKVALGEYMAAEESRKAALYG